MSITYHGDHVYRMTFTNEPLTYRCPICRKLDLGQRTGGGAHKQLPFATDLALDMRDAQEVVYRESVVASWFRPR